jgi:cobalt/nickel transport system permease protein
MTQRNLPVWLSMEEKYLPPSDRDTFINKSIYGLLGILSRIRSQGVRGNMFGVSASLHLASTFVIVLIVTLSHKYLFVLVAIVYLLSFLSLLKGENIIKILKVSFIVMGFASAVLLPSFFLGNRQGSVMMITKIFVTVTSAGILSHAVPWHSLTGSMKRFFVPDIFIFVLDITLKYINMLGELSLQMLYSLRARSIGRNRNKYTALSGIAGTLFIRSVEMSQEMHSAMECRGFTGRYTGQKKVGISVANIFFIFVNGTMVFIFFYLRAYD